MDRPLTVNIKPKDCGEIYNHICVPFEFEYIYRTCIFDLGHLGTAQYLWGGMGLGVMGVGLICLLKYETLLIILNLYPHPP